MSIWLQSILQFHYVLAASLFAFRLTGDRDYYLTWVTNISVCIVKKKTLISNAGSDIYDYIYTLQTLSKLFFTMTDKSITYVQHKNNIWFFTYQCFTCNFKGFTNMMKPTVAIEFATRMTSVELAQNDRKLEGQHSRERNAWTLLLWCRWCLIWIPLQNFAKNWDLLCWPCVVIIWCTFIIFTQNIHHPNFLNNMVWTNRLYIYKLLKWDFMWQKRLFTF